MEEHYISIQVESVRVVEKVLRSSLKSHWTFVLCDVAQSTSARPMWACSASPSLAVAVRTLLPRPWAAPLLLEQLSRCQNRGRTFCSTSWGLRGYSSVTSSERHRITRQFMIRLLLALVLEFLDLPATFSIRSSFAFPLTYWAFEQKGCKSKLLSKHIKCYMKLIQKSSKCETALKVLGAYHLTREIHLD